jgi:hypothetical protein
VGGLVEILEGVSSLIEEFVLEAAELAEALDGGRFEGMTMAPEIPKSGPRRR